MVRRRVVQEGSRHACGTGLVVGEIALTLTLLVAASLRWCGH